MPDNFHSKVSFIWSIADLLRGNYKPSEYHDVILPLTVLRRLDAVLEPTKDKVLTRYLQVKKELDQYDSLLKSVAGYSFYNTSKFTFKSLMQDPDNIAINLKNYINGFSKNMYEIIENFEFDNEIDKLDKADLLFLIIEKFNDIDLHPEKVSNHEMGTIFEELIRKFSEQANETAGEHFTPREVIKLMVKLIVAGNGGLKTPNIIKSIYDPACGTGGMLTIAKNEITRKINPSAKVFLFGQELNPKTYAIAKSDMLIKGENADQIKKGNSFSQDQLENEKFDYMISNPPYGVEWKNVAKQVKAEYENLGFDGRFGAGLPRINDGSFLFLQHMISKMRAISDGGSRIAVIFNGSPLFTGDAGGGESEIRRWIIEHDWLEAIIGLPDQLFYNTGIHTYIWLVTNVKPKNRQEKIQLIDSRKMFKICAQKFGSKRHFIDDEQIEDIVSLYKSFENKGKSKIFTNDFFGYRKITVEQPKEDDKTKPEPQLRDYERVPLIEDIHEYFEREVKPHVPEAWIDETKTKIGYEISFTKYFYEYKPLRPLEEIETDIKKLHEETEKLMKEIFND